MKQLSFEDINDNKKSWDALSDRGKWFLGPHGRTPGIHPDAPPPKPPENPYFRLLRAWNQEQRDRFRPAPRLGEGK